MERLQEILRVRLERLQEIVSGLSARDRKLLAALAAGALLAVLLGGTMALTGSLRRQRSLLDERETQLTQLTALTADHASALAQIEAIEARIGEHEGTDLQAFLEQAGKAVGISDRLNAVKEKSTTQEGTLEDKLYTVTLSKLTVAEYANFLFEVEAAGYPLKIRSTRVKRRARGEEITLDVDMDISAFRIVEPATQGEG